LCVWLDLSGVGNLLRVFAMSPIAVVGANVN